MLKGQDMVVLAALMGGRSSGLAYAGLASRARLSVSEAHAAVQRLRDASLVSEGHCVKRRNAREFLLHGLKYLFPPKIEAGLFRGLPASYAAPVAEDEFSVSGEIPVWRSETGTAYGRALAPLYPTAPEAAAADRGMYDRLAVMDMLRGGRLRERAFAERKLEELM